MNSRVVVIPILPSLNHLALDLSRHHEGVLAIYCIRALNEESGMNLVTSLSQNRFIDGIYLITSGSDSESELVAKLEGIPKVNALNLRQGVPLRETIEALSAVISAPRPDAQMTGELRLKTLIVGADEVVASSQQELGEKIVQECQKEGMALEIKAIESESTRAIFDQEIIIDLSPQCNRYMNQAAGAYISLREVEDLKELSIGDLAQLISSKIRELLTLNAEPSSNQISTLYL